MSVVLDIDRDELEYVTIALVSFGFRIVGRKRLLIDNGWLLSGLTIDKPTDVCGVTRSEYYCTSVH